MFLGDKWPRAIYQAIRKRGKRMILEIRDRPSATGLVLSIFLGKVVSMQNNENQVLVRLY